MYSLLLEKKIPLLPFEFDSSFIHATDSIQILALIVDKNLKFKNHMTHVSPKCSESVWLLFDLEHFLPHELMLKLRKFVPFLPYISFSIETWYTTSRSPVSQVQMLPKKLRDTSNLNFNTHTNSHFEQAYSFNCEDSTNKSLLPSI